jgi:putative flippase GtrA
LYALIRKILNRETITYLICGGATTAFGLALFWVCVRVNLGTVSANTITTFFSIIFAYIINKVFVFQSSSWAVKAVWREMLYFFYGRLLTYVSETGLLVLLADIAGLPVIWCKGFTMVLVVAANYLISKRFVFKK